MKRIAFALAFLMVSVASAFAACTGPAVMHDFPGTSFNMSLSAAPDANCGSVVNQGTQAATANAWPIKATDGTNTAAVFSAGADTVSNSTGQLVSGSFGYFYNGTTWDRMRGDTTNGLWVNVKSSVLPTGAATAANQSTEITALNTIATNTGAAIPPQAVGVPIGGFGLCDGANGSTNPCTTVATVKAASTPAAATDKALVVDQRPGTTILSGSDPSSGKGTPSSVAINVSTATTTQLVAISGSTSIYVTSFDVIAGGTGNITFEYGTGVNCGTGTTALTGAYNLTAQTGIAKGNGLGTILKVPSGNALCVLTTAAVQMSGSVSYQQF